MPYGGIVERPRLGHSDSYHPLRAARKHDLSEEAPLRESMTKPHRMYHEGKRLNENLRPLKRFIRGQVGRPWDKVYSEINEHVKVSNAVQAHIRQHLRDFLAVSILRDKYGRVWDTTRLWPSEMRKGDLFVDTDGIVKVFKGPPKVKVDRGMKIYAMYKARKSKRPQKDWAREEWYYELEYRLVEYSKMEEESISSDRVVSYFYAGTRTDAVKHVRLENERNKKYHWFDREYVPPQNKKPKAKKVA